MSGDRPSTRILAAWAHVSARSKARPIVRQEAVHPRRPITAGGGLAATVAVAIVAVGLLAVVGQRHDPASTVSPSAPGPSMIPATRSPAAATRRPIGTFMAGQLVTAIDGWTLSGTDLLVTHDGGRSWAVTASPAPSSERMVGAAFADAMHRWVVSDRVPAAGSSGVLGVEIHRTDDGGATWQAAELASIASPGPDPLVGFPTISVVSSDVVYVLLDVEGGSGPDHRLYATVDGGRSWQLRPGVPSTLHSIAFLDSLVGWAVTDNVNALVRTVDAGKHWVRQGLPAVPGVRASDLAAFDGLTRTADGHLVLFAPTAQDGGRGAFFTSQDDGSTWTFAVRGPSGAGPHAAFLDDGTWILGGLPSLLISHDAGATWSRGETNLPGLLESVAVAGGSHLSAVVSVSSCPPNADCFMPRQLWISDDAGTSWREATP
jgi:photosystem II stability/assembly factor-like uncharacterized protein